MATDETTKPERPTRAAMDALARRVELLESLLETAREERDAATEDRNRWREVRSPDAEAQAIADCVRAVGVLLDGGGNNANRLRRGEMQYLRSSEWFPAPASATPVGRLLLHLAARFGVPLQEVVPEPERESAGNQLVLVSAEVAETLARAGEVRG